jgi:sugar phosphate isomerase/epimerase
MLTRRECLATLAAPAALAAAQTPEPITICAFSKHWHWTDVQETARICAEMGYEGIDLTVRPQGHVEPERVEEDLPKAVETIKKAGLTIPMITSGIIDVTTPYTEKVIRTMAALGIRRYRWGTFRYVNSKPLPAQLDELKPKVHELASLNHHYGVCAMYHTHSGVGQVGASFWDLYLLLKDEDTNAVSVNYDVGHATVEGGYGGWIHSCRLLLPYMRGIAVKDFRWKQNERGAWVPGWCPLSDGMVNFKLFFSMIKAGGFSGPLQLHMEHPELGGADQGLKQFTIPKEKLLAVMWYDLDKLKAMLRDAGIPTASAAR